jgi:hypothetical protein
MKFAASLFFRERRSDHGEPLWQLSIVIVEAEDDPAARRAVLQFAKRQRTAFRTVTGADVVWEFDTIGEVAPIIAESDGGVVEAFSTFLRESEARSLQTPFDDE